MTLQSQATDILHKLQTYAYPEFIIDLETDQIQVNLIDYVSGQIVQHISAAELTYLLQTLLEA